MGSPITAQTQSVAGHHTVNTYLVCLNMKTLLVALALFGLAFGVPQGRPQRPPPCQKGRGCNKVKIPDFTGTIPGFGQVGGRPGLLGKKKRSAHEEIAASGPNHPDAEADNKGYWGHGRGSGTGTSAYWGKKKRSADEETAGYP